jgi:hypothetical protein
MNISAKKKSQRSDLFEQIAQMIQWATSCFSTGIGLLELSFVFDSFLCRRFEIIDADASGTLQITAAWLQR